MTTQTQDTFTLNSSEANPVSEAQKISQISTVNLETVEHFSNVCRTCATITEFVIPIFHGDGIHNNLAEKIHKHLPIQVSEQDQLPQVVCYQCASTLLAWHELVECCVQAEKALQTAVQNRLLASEASEAEKPKPGTSSEVDRKENLSVIHDKLIDTNNYIQTIKTVLMNYFEAINFDIKQEDILYVCHKCKDVTSQDLDELTLHLLSKHRVELITTSSLKEFVDNNITFEEILNNSDNESIEETEEESYVFQCALCKIYFTSNTRLLCHMNKHTDSVSDNQYVCEVCEYTDQNKIKFIKHLQSHALIVIDDKTICKSCGFSADDMTTLRDHVIKSHAVKKTKDSAFKRTNQKYIPTPCPECNKLFSNKYNLNVHMKQHSGITKSYACDTCQKMFSNESNLKKHKKIQHEGVVEFTCSQCGEGFPTKVSRDTHYRSHTGENPYICYICRKSYRLKDTLKKHIDTHLDIRNYGCHICEKKFRKKSHLDYHIRTHRVKILSKSQSCWEYDILEDQESNHTIESNESSIYEKLETDSEDDIPLSNIRQENQNKAYEVFYKALVNFANHYEKNHRDISVDSSDSEISDAINENVDNFDDLTQTNMRNSRLDEETRLDIAAAQTKINGKVFYTCKLCGSNLSSTNTYLAHKRIHSGEKPCICHICGKRFRAPNGLQRHVTQTHERQRRHSCTICSKLFANSQNLKQHMRIHTGDKPYVCSQCGKSFTQHGSLYSHMKTHKEEYPYNCAECGSKFRLKAGLVRHKLKHTGERPHVCSICEKSFKLKQDLKLHVASHSTDVQFPCNMCGAVFKLERARRLHQRRVHKT